MTDIIVDESATTTIVDNIIQVVSVCPSTTTIVDNNNVTINVVNNSIEVVTINSQSIAAVKDDNIEVVTIGIQGPAGQGIPAGGLKGEVLTKSSNISYDLEWNIIGNVNTATVAGQIISALKIVYTDPVTSKIFYADKDAPNTVNSLLGLSTQSGGMDDFINVITYGQLTDVTWNWNMAGDVNLFLGSNGTIVQGAPVGAITVRIGYAISSTSILIRMGEPVLTA